MKEIQMHFVFKFVQIQREEHVLKNHKVYFETKEVYLIQYCMRKFLSIQ